MSQTPLIEARKREQLGSRYTRRLRKEGQLPAVIYGHQKEPLHVSVDVKQFGELLIAGTQVLRVSVDGSAEPVLVKDVQWNHLSSAIIHADLARVDLTEEVDVQVELSLVGDPEGLKTAGAYLDRPLATLNVRARANNIPELITHDISSLEVGQPLLAGDLQLPEGVTLIEAEDTVVAQVVLGRGETAEEDASGDEEPEVISKEKEGGAEEKA